MKCVICGEEADFIIEISQKDMVLCDMQEEESDEAGFGLCKKHACCINMIVDLLPVEWVKFTY